MAISQRSLPTSVQLTFSLGEPHASRSAFPEGVPDLTIQGEILPLSLSDWLAGYAFDGLYGKTSLVSLTVIEDEILLQSSQRFGNAGIASPTGCLTLNTTESPSDAVECFLLDILETTGDHLPKYFLSSKACLGVVTRAEKKDQKLPNGLAQALKAVAAATSQKQ